MLVTGIIVLGVAVYAVWAVRKIRKDRKNGACCGGSCSGCVGKEYCSKLIDVQPMLSERRVSASFLHLHSWQGCNIIQIGL